VVSDKPLLEPAPSWLAQQRFAARLQDGRRAGGIAVDANGLNGALPGEAYGLRGGGGSAMSASAKERGRREPSGS
jgi:hypothetical protein